MIMRCFIGCNLGYDVGSLAELCVSSFSLVDDHIPMVPGMFHVFG